MLPVSDFYWIGGSPCSGKSSIADALAARYNLTTYHCDEHFPKHSELATPQAQPVMSRLPHMTCDDIWLEPVEAQVKRVFDIYAEEFPMILEDLTALSGKVIVEGTALLPVNVYPHLKSPEHCIYLIPSHSFQIKHYLQREWRNDVLKDCSDPDRAFENWMERDHQFGQQIKLEAMKEDMLCLTVEEIHDLEYYVERIAAHFGLT